MTITIPTWIVWVLGSFGVIVLIATVITLCVLAKVGWQFLNISFKYRG